MGESKAVVPKTPEIAGMEHNLRVCEAYNSTDDLSSHTIWYKNCYIGFTTENWFP